MEVHPRVDADAATASAAKPAKALDPDLLPKVAGAFVRRLCLQPSSCSTPWRCSTARSRGVPDSCPRRKQERQRHTATRAFRGQQRATPGKYMAENGPRQKAPTKGMKGSHRGNAGQ